MDDECLKDVLRYLYGKSLGLNRIHVSVTGNIKVEIPNNRLTITSWMEIYKNAKTLDERTGLRQVAINITELYGYKNAISEHGTFAAKYEASFPYNFFLTTVSMLEETFGQPYSLSFHEIIDYSGGEIVDSLHINFMLDLLWITTEYMLAAQYPKMTVIYGSLVDPLHHSQIPFDINIIEIEMPEFGCHHSKISIFKYKNDSIRIVISTANLYRSDWDKWTQGLWVSPILPPLPENALDSVGESVTHFKKDFMDYLAVYTQPAINEWKSLIQRADCSAVKVFFFASVPRYHEGPSINLWGHKRLYNILKENTSLPDNAKDWPIVAQSGSVGVFGPYYQSWMSNHIVLSMAKEKDKKIIHLPEFRFLYPTKETFENSFDKKTGSTALFYHEDEHLKQYWLEDNLYEWTFERTGRGKAMPHCKSYTRISPDETEIAWFVLTSANLSKAAWGKMVKKGTCHFIANYEAGVVFIPQIMINRPTFPIKESDDSKIPTFLLPYDVPLCRYKPGMKIAVLPGSRFSNDVSEEEMEKNSGENSEKQEDTDAPYSEETVDKIIEHLLKPNKSNHPVNTELHSN